MDVIKSFIGMLLKGAKTAEPAAEVAAKAAAEAPGTKKAAINELLLELEARKELAARRARTAAPVMGAAAEQRQVLGANYEQALRQQGREEGEIQKLVAAYRQQEARKQLGKRGFNPYSQMSVPVILGLEEGLPTKTTTTAKR